MELILRAFCKFVTNCILYVNWIQEDYMLPRLKRGLGLGRFQDQAHENFPKNPINLQFSSGLSVTTNP